MRLGPFLRDIVSSWFRRTSSDVGGGVLITFALTLPVFLMVAGAAVDYGFLFDRKSHLQAAADASALAAARELLLANSDDDLAKAVAQSAAMANLADKSSGASITTLVDAQTASVTVSITQAPALFFIDQFTGETNSAIQVSATARVVGDLKVCVIALEDQGSGTVSLESSARLTANDCAVFSNSISDTGLVAKNSSLLTSAFNCTTGGFSGTSANFEPMPLTDCPAVEDPLASRPEPPSGGGCKETDLEIEDQTVTLSPGNYCGGILIQGNSRVTLNPGIYVIKDGKFLVEDMSELIGANVGFLLLGNKSNLTFKTDTTIDLTAPKDGPMAGLLFFEDRNKTAQGTHKILSNNARVLLGTIYLSKSKLVVDADAPVADQSAYTAIVARQLKLFSGPNLVLNTDYGATDIPVPNGIKGTGQNVVLAE